MRFTRDEVAASVAAELTSAPLATLALSQKRAAGARATGSDPPRAAPGSPRLS